MDSKISKIELLYRHDYAPWLQVSNSKLIEQNPNTYVRSFRTHHSAKGTAPEIPPRSYLHIYACSKFTRKKIVVPTEAQSLSIPLSW